MKDIKFASEVTLKLQFVCHVTLRHQYLCKEFVSKELAFSDGKPSVFGVI
jgi:hypothetical protein